MPDLLGSEQIRKLQNPLKNGPTVVALAAEVEKLRDAVSNLKARVLNLELATARGKK